MQGKTKQSKLAKFGGSPMLSRSELIRYNPIGKRSISAAVKVLKSGNLSEFVGEWGENFYGGPKMRELEDLCKSMFETKYAVSMNSWTSGLIAAVGAIGIEPGDEIITTPYTMCATATSILHWNAIPVFVDIDPRTFNIDATKIEEKISSNTKAIMVVDICGQPADMDEIKVIANKHNLKIITDSAQAPGAKYKGQFAGTLSDIGGYSFNFHKHIHSGEGGICFTNNEDLANNLQLIRNHAEAVVLNKGHANYINMVGYNFRLGELEAAILIPQLLELEKIISRRVQMADILNQNLSNLDGLETPFVAKDRTHSFYTYSLLIPTESQSGVPRSEIVDALQKEGVPAEGGYQNLHMLPMYQKKIAYGSKGFPWSNGAQYRNIDYSHGTCPVAELIHEEKVVTLSPCDFEFTNSQLNKIGEAFHKVWNHYYK